MKNIFLLHLHANLFYLFYPPGWPPSHWPHMSNFFKFSRGWFCSHVLNFLTVRVPVSRGLFYFPRKFFLPCVEKWLKFFSLSKFQFSKGWFYFPRFFLLPCVVDWRTFLTFEFPIFQRLILLSSKFFCSHVLRSCWNFLLSPPSFGETLSLSCWHKDSCLVAPLSFSEEGDGGCQNFR